ncbi:transcriptional regulator [Thermobacillus composti KWC4]|uniref:Transcriptional regulator n=2 Tax=Thermobacillus TaxID=76632 RepID=L0E9J3_THECK|nr:transcriptional regulator [Thermobacillus composti KWC4]
MIYQDMVIRMMHKMNVPLYERIYNHLLEKIKNGELTSGDRVPSEKELADHFNVSRITSKKALELLALQKVIERVQGKGSFVSQNLPDLDSLKPLDPNGDQEEDGAKNAPARSASPMKTIAFILPDFADSYGLRLIHGVEERCSQIGARMFIKLTYDNREEEEEAIRSFIHLGVDGIVIFPVHGEHYNPELVRLVLDKFPVVLIDRYLKGIATAAVYTDNRQAAFELTDRLIQRGHTQIGFISAPADNTSTIEDRIIGFTMAFAKRGLSLPPGHMMTNLYSSLPRSFESRNISVDIETVRRFVEGNPHLTAFVVAEYNLALIVHQALISLGKRIPEDCQIVCFDSPDEPFGNHRFTHVRQDEFAMGRKAVDLLEKLWDGEEVQMHNIIPYRIIEGSSTR